MLKGNIYTGFSKKPYLTELVANGQHLLHGIKADAGWLERIAVQESLLQLFSESQFGSCLSLLLSLRVLLGLLDGRL